MADLQEIIFRLRVDQSIRTIHKETGIHKTIIRKLKMLASQHNWLKSESSSLTEEVLRQALIKQGISNSR